MIKTSFQLRTIGTLLRERRKERRLTISQIAEITKIRSEYLRAIELGNYDIFPSEVYLKGFLKNYSKFLGVNTERALAMYRREREYKEKEPTIGNARKLKGSNFSIILTPGRVIALFILIAVVLTVIYIGSYVGRIFQAPELSLTSPIDLSAGQEETIRVKDDQLLLEGEVEIGATLTINGQDFQTNNFEKFTEKLDLQPGANRFQLVAESQFGKTSEIILNVFNELEPEIVEPSTTPTPSPSPSPSGQLLTMTGTITIVNRDAYIELTLDGEQTIGRVVPIGETIQFEDVSVIELFTPRPDAIEITINNESETLINTTNKWEIVNGEIVKN